MPKYNTDYLKFDAFSIKEALIRRLSDNDTFTDQLFEGSNLVTLIDCFSHLYELLMYYTNHSASESIFNDTQLYENMNRIVKLLGYNPLGGLSSKTTVSFYDESESIPVFTDDSTQKEISKYASLDTRLTDSKGNSIYYSLVDRLFVSKVNAKNEINTFTVVNGRWKVYERTFLAEGTPFEEFVLTNLNLDPDSDDVKYIAHPYIDVYVKTIDEGTGEEIFEEYNAIYEGNIFGTNDIIVSPISKKFELRINENKRYSIKFGDNIHGKKLKNGDEIYVVYLEGNGPEGNIGASVIDQAGGFVNSIAGIDNKTFLAFLGLKEDESDQLVSPEEMKKIHFTNILPSTSYQTIESVETIRKNAPIWVKGNNRLVLKEDYEQFMQIYHGSDLYDVKVMNQWEYAASFYHWLNTYDKLSPSIRSAGYLYTDACDFNNIYIWVKTKDIEIDQALVYEEMLNKKSLTAEPKIVSALNTIFVPCLTATDNGNLNLTTLKYSISNWDANYENWLEIVKTKDSYISAEKIRSNVINTIKTFFRPDLNELGSKLDINNLYTQLLSIDGVNLVRMAYRPVGTNEGDTVYYNGISFAKWTPLLVAGADVEIIKGSYKLETFQFPILLEENLSSRIKIVAESFGQSSVEF